MYTDSEAHRTLAEFVGPRIQRDPAPDTTTSTDLGARIDWTESGYYSAERAHPDRYHLNRRDPTDRAILDHGDPATVSGVRQSGQSACEPR